MVFRGGWEPRSPLDKFIENGERYLANVRHQDLVNAQMGQRPNMSDDDKDAARLAIIKQTNGIKDLHKFGKYENDDYESLKAFPRVSVKEDKINSDEYSKVPVGGIYQVMREHDGKPVPSGVFRRKLSSNGSVPDVPVSTDFSFGRVLRGAGNAIAGDVDSLGALAARPIGKDVAADWAKAAEDRGIAANTQSELGSAVGHVATALPAAVGAAAALPELGFVGAGTLGAALAGGLLGAGEGAQDDIATGSDGLKTLKDSAIGAAGGAATSSLPGVGLTGRALAKLPLTRALPGLVQKAGAGALVGASTDAAVRGVQHGLAPDSFEGPSTESALASGLFGAGAHVLHREEAPAGAANVPGEGAPSVGETPEASPQPEPPAEGEETAQPETPEQPQETAPTESTEEDETPAAPYSPEHLDELLDDTRDRDFDEQSERHTYLSELANHLADRKALHEAGEDPSISHPWQKTADTISPEFYDSTRGEVLNALHNAKDSVARGRLSDVAAQLPEAQVKAARFLGEVEDSLDESSQGDTAPAHMLAVDIANAKTPEQRQEAQKKFRAAALQKVEQASEQGVEPPSPSNFMSIAHTAFTSPKSIKRGDIEGLVNLYMSAGDSQKWRLVHDTLGRAIVPDKTPVTLPLKYRPWEPIVQKSIMREPISPEDYHYVKAALRADAESGPDGEKLLPQDATNQRHFKEVLDKHRAAYEHPGKVFDPKTDVLGPLPGGRKEAERQRKEAGKAREKSSLHGEPSENPFQKPDGSPDRLPGLYDPGSPEVMRHHAQQLGIGPFEQMQMLEDSGGDRVSLGRHLAAEVEKQLLQAQQEEAVRTDARRSLNWLRLRKDSSELPRLAKAVRAHTAKVLNEPRTLRAALRSKLGGLLYDYADQGGKTKITKAAKQMSKEIIDELKHHEKNLRSEGRRELESSGRLARTADDLPNARTVPRDILQQHIAALRDPSQLNALPPGRISMLKGINASERDAVKQLVVAGSDGRAAQRLFPEKLNHGLDTGILRRLKNSAGRLMFPAAMRKALQDYHGVSHGELTELLDALEHQNDLLSKLKPFSMVSRSEGENSELELLHALIDRSKEPRPEPSLDAEKKKLNGLTLPELKRETKKNPKKPTALAARNRAADQLYGNYAGSLRKMTRQFPKLTPEMRQTLYRAGRDIRALDRAEGLQTPETAALGRLYKNWVEGTLEGGAKRPKGLKVDETGKIMYGDHTDTPTEDC